MRLKPIGSRLVCMAGGMLPTVNLDDEPRFVTNEVHNVRA